MSFKLNIISLMSSSCLTTFSFLLINFEFRLDDLTISYDIQYMLY
jgi:hypothetical protein